MCIEEEERHINDCMDERVGRSDGYNEFYISRKLIGARLDPRGPASVAEWLRAWDTLTIF